MNVGIQLGQSVGELDGFKVDTSLGGNPVNMFQRVFFQWQSNPVYPYTWATVLEAIASPVVGQTNIADDIVEKLKTRYLQRMTCKTCCLFCICLCVVHTTYIV